MLAAAAPVSADGGAREGKLGAGITADTSVLAPSDAGGVALTTRALVEASAEVDGTRWGWSGGTVFVGAQAFVGERGDAITGDVQTFDNIDADPFAGLVEAWVQHEAWGGRLRIKLGRMDANSEFASLAERPRPRRMRSRREFVHSSMGFSPTLVAFPSYPAQSLGGVIEGRPHPRLRLQGGLYDGTLTPAPMSTRLSFGDAPPFSSLYLVGEASVGWQLGRGDGHAALGGWGRLRDPVCDAEGCATPAGPYAFATQTLFRERGGGPVQGVTAFVQYAWTPARVSDIVHHAGGGLSWSGAWPGRERDVLGAGVSWVRLAEAVPRRDEIAIELFDRLATGEAGAYLQPDLQVLVFPGGADHHAVALTIRVGVDL